MKNSILRKLSLRLTALASLLALPLLLSSCGGGGGSGVEGPAPRVLNGLTLALSTSGGPIFSFISIDDFVSEENPDIDTGIVTMVASPSDIPTVGANGTPGTICFAPTISNASYTYKVISGSTAVLTITGTGANVPSILDPVDTCALENAFVLTYNILYGSTGGAINELILTPVPSASSGSASFLMNLFSNNSLMTLQSGGLVPEGYGLVQSRSVAPRLIVPNTIGSQNLRLSVDGDTSLDQSYVFINSNYQPFSNIDLLLESGQGLSSLDSDPANPTTLDWSWQPGETSSGTLGNNVGVLSVFDEFGQSFVYDFTFAQLQDDGTVTGGSESGVYVRDDGQTGQFNFPFLDNFFQ